MEWLTDPQAWVALATLTALEIVLGIDNIIFYFHPRVKVASVPTIEGADARAHGRHGDSTPVVIFFVMAHEPDGSVV